MCFDFINNFCLKHFSFQEELSEIWSKVYIDHRVKYPLFCQILIKWHDFWKEFLNPKYVFWFYQQLLSETFLIPRGIERDMIKSVYWSSCKVPVILSDFNDIWIFSTVFRKMLIQGGPKVGIQYMVYCIHIFGPPCPLNFMKFRPLVTWRS